MTLCKRFLKPQLIVLAFLLFCPVSGQEPLLCMGAYWTEDDANLMMKGFASEWDDRVHGRNGHKPYRQGIVEGMQLEKMPVMEGTFIPSSIAVKRWMAMWWRTLPLKAFPGFWVTGNLYTPLSPRRKNPAVLCPHGHAADKRFTADVQIRSAALARMGAIVFAYDMVGYGESQQVNHKIPIALVLQTYNSRGCWNTFFPGPMWILHGLG